MSRKAFEMIKAGLEDAIAYAEGDKNRGRERRVYVPNIDVAVMRARLGLSQGDFAAAFGVSVATVRNWEQGRRRPDGPARVLLAVVDREPEAVLRALDVPRSEAKAAPRRPVASGKRRVG
jgi:putative transcriptional regulator